MEVIIETGKKVRSLLESLPNGILKNPLTVNISSLKEKTGITFIPSNFIVFEVVSVSEVTAGKLIETSSSEKLRKYECSSPNARQIFFLRGLFVDKKTNFFYLSFLEYEVSGKEHPFIKNFKLEENDIEIS